MATKKTAPQQASADDRLSRLEKIVSKLADDLSPADPCEGPPLGRYSAPIGIANGIPEVRRSIPNSVDNLSNEICSLADIVENLVNRLTPVLRYADPDNGGTSTLCGPSIVPLSGDVDSQTWRIISLRCLAQDALERLEI